MVGCKNTTDSTVVQNVLILNRRLCEMVLLLVYAAAEAKLRMLYGVAMLLLPIAYINVFIISVRFGFDVQLIHKNNMM